MPLQLPPSELLLPRLLFRHKYRRRLLLLLLRRRLLHRLLLLLLGRWLHRKTLLAKIS
jgi:hypothetical protein